MLESSRLPLEVKLPKVNTSSSESLRNALTRMGLGSLFDNADFSAMSPEVSGISDCVQQVLLDVDERETTAAATVEMVMLTCAHGGARTPRPPLVCDRNTRPGRTTGAQPPRYRKSPLRSGGDCYLLTFCVPTIR